MKNLFSPLTEIRLQAFISKLTLVVILVLSMNGYLNAQTSDITAPDVRDFSFTPSVINTTDNSQTVTVTVRAVDSQRGVGLVGITFRSVILRYQTVQILMDSQHRISGDNKDGIYQAMVVFPQFSKDGMWEVSNVIVFSATGGNQGIFNTSDLAEKGFVTQLQVISGSEDVTPPELVDFSITPSVVDMTNGLQTATVTARLKDFKSGVKSIIVNFHNPDANGEYPTMNAVNPLYLTSSNRVSGDEKDGIYQSTTTFSTSAYQRTYGISIILTDKLANNAVLYTNDLAEHGFTSLFQIINRAQLATFSISGRILSANGRGVSRAVVTLIESNGTVKYATTNPFGYYRFTNIVYGGTGLRVKHKRRNFDLRTLWIERTMFDVNLTEITVAGN